MAKTITGQEYPLKEIFSKRFDFSIPPYQRPYAWGRTQAVELFDDLYSFSLSESSSEDYFLGSIVLIKDDNVPAAQVVDGQQRLTTLTILFAVIASRLSGDYRKMCWHYIFEEGNELEDIKPRARLRLRERDASFFRQYVQELKIKELGGLSETHMKTEAQRHIQENAVVFEKLIDEKFNNNPKGLVAFTKFIVQRCFLVAVSTPSQQSAFRVFSVLNNRGLDLLPIDIIKADLIGKICADKQDYYTRLWEEIEDATGREGLNTLFGHIRTIYAKAKANKSLMEEFNEFVVPHISSPEAFIDKVMNPYADAYRVIEKKAYQSENYAAKVNELLGWLLRVNNSDWQPPAILFLARNPSESDLLKFLTKLERLVAYMHICALFVNDRIQRYAKIVDEISSGVWPVSLELTDEEQRDFIAKLSGEIYGMTALRRNYVMLRLDSFVSDHSATYTPSVLTIEHVLPQTPKANSEWLRWWPNEDERKSWTHRVANLVPLPRQKNSEAQNFEFSKKKDLYFKSRKTGTTVYALTTQVLNEKEWTPEVLKKRQEMLLGKLKECWDLNGFHQSVGELSNK